MTGKDMFGFDDAPANATAITENIQAADDRTLRLAAPYFTAEQLEQFIAYQRAFKSRLDTSPLHPEHGNTHLATAHAAALEASGLAASAQSQISAVVAKFCAQVATRRALAEKQQTLRKHIAAIEASGADPKPDERELDHRITGELLRLQSLQPLERRYGKEAIALLAARESELLQLHTEITRRVSGR